MLHSGPTRMDNCCSNSDSSIFLSCFRSLFAQHDQPSETGFSSFFRVFVNYSTTNYFLLRFLMVFAITSIAYLVIVKSSDHVPTNYFYRCSLFFFSYVILWNIMTLFELCLFDLNVLTTFQSTSSSCNAYQIFFSCIFVTASISVFSFVFLDEIPYLSVIYSALNSFLLTVVVQNPNDSNTLMYVVVIISLFAILLGISKLSKTDNDGLERYFKRGLMFVYSNSLYLLPVFLLSSTLQFLQIDTLLRLCLNIQRDSYSLFFLSFIVAFSYFFISHFNHLFTVVFLRKAYLAKENGDEASLGVSDFLAALSETWKSIYYIAYYSFVPALLQFVFTFVYFVCLLMNNSNHTVMRLFSCFTCVLIGVWSLKAIFSGSKTSSVLTTLGVLGSDYNDEDNKIENANTIESIYSESFSVLDFQFVVNLVFSILFYFNYAIFSYTYTHIICPIFVSINVFLYFMNSFYASRTVEKFSKKDFDYSEQTNNYSVEYTQNPLFPENEEEQFEYTINIAEQANAVQALSFEANEMENRN